MEFIPWSNSAYPQWSMHFEPTCAYVRRAHMHPILYPFFWVNTTGRNTMWVVFKVYVFFFCFSFHPEDLMTWHQKPTCSVYLFLILITAAPLTQITDKWLRFIYLMHTSIQLQWLLMARLIWWCPDFCQLMSPPFCQDRRQKPCRFHASQYILPFSHCGQAAT